MVFFFFGILFELLKFVSLKYFANFYLLKNYYVTLDIPPTSEPKSIIRLLTDSKFTVVYSLPVANIMDIKGNIVVKIDDTDLIVEWRNSKRLRKVSLTKDKFTAEGHKNWFINSRDSRSDFKVDRDSC